MLRHFAKYIQCKLWSHTNSVYIISSCHDSLIHTNLLLCTKYYPVYQKPLAPGWAQCTFPSHCCIQFISLTECRGQTLCQSMNSKVRVWQRLWPQKRLLMRRVRGQQVQSSLCSHGFHIHRFHRHRSKVVHTIPIYPKHVEFFPCHAALSNVV